jgi:adenylate cyclase
MTTMPDQQLQSPAASDAPSPRLRWRRQNPQLPPRIRKQIEAHDQSSEVLVKIIQLVIVSIWAALYWVAPKTSTDSAFSPVVWALAAYFTLNLAALFWARQARLPDWAVFTSILLDVGILMLLIWSFHIQYEQPPSFYLKAPTLLYVFIFIALRALRFEPRFVIFTGVAAAAGWLALVVYAIHSAHGMMTTRDYIKYLTGNEILLGAEFDKIITILMVAGIIAVALVRANDLLLRATSEAQAAQDLSRFFDRDIASNIRNAEEAQLPGTGERVEAAILNVDLRGFTTYAADLDPGEVLNLLIAYQKRTVAIIQRHGGSIDKFLGDGIMATFGAVRRNQTYAADALRAVDDIITDSESWAADPVLQPFAGAKVNAAVASGAIVFGAIGDDTRLEYTVIGSAANLSAKLEKHNKELKTRALTDEPTYQLALQQGYQSPAPRKAVRTSLAAASRVVPLG